jgi:hypothetical protein
VTDVEALQRLPPLLRRAGYVDALAVYATPPSPAQLSADLALLPPATATLVETFFLQGRVRPEALATAFGPDEPELSDALVRLGVLIRRDGLFSTGQLVALPLFGAGVLALVPSPRGSPNAYFGPDVAALLQRVVPLPGRALVLGTDPGLLAVRAAAAAERVVSVGADPIAVGCAELNAAMNGVAARVESRAGTLYEALTPDEKFDLVLASAPTSPVPIAGARTYPGRDGPAVARHIVEGLPRVLSADGVAHLAAVWHGGEAGPDPGFDLAALATSHGLGVVMTLPSRQPVTPGSPLFETLVARTARLGGLDEKALRHSYATHLAERHAAYLYLSFMTISRSRNPGLMMTRHYLKPGGSWLR